MCEDLCAGLDMSEKGLCELGSRKIIPIDKSEMCANEREEDYNAIGA